MRYVAIHDLELLPKLRRFVGWHYFAPNAKPNLYIVARNKLIVPIVSRSPSSYQYLQQQLDKFKHQSSSCNICLEDRDFYVQCANPRCTALLCANCSLQSSILCNKCPFCRECFVPKDILDLPAIPNDIEFVTNFIDKYHTNRLHVMFLDNGDSYLFDHHLIDRMAKTHCIIGVFDSSSESYSTFIDSLDWKEVHQNKHTELSSIFSNLFSRS